MDEVNRDAFRTLMLEKGTTEVLVAEAMGHLEHLAGVAEGKSTNLRSAKEVDAETVRSAIAGATGRAVKRVHLVSLSRPPIKPQWMSRRAYEAGLRASFSASLWWDKRNIEEDPWRCLYRRLNSCFWERYENHPPMYGIHSTIEENIWRGLKHNLAADLRADPRARVWKAFSPNIRANILSKIWHNLETSITYTIGFTLIGQEEEARKLFALLDTWDGAIILGEIEDRPGVWFVLVA